MPKVGETVPAPINPGKPLPQGNSTQFQVVPNGVPMLDSTPTTTARPETREPF
jgi:hypothetical protein